MSIEEKIGFIKNEILDLLEKSNDNMSVEFVKAVRGLNDFQINIISGAVSPIAHKEFTEAASGLGAIFTFMASDMNKMRKRIKVLEEKLKVENVR